MLETLWPQRQISRRPKTKTNFATEDTQEKVFLAPVLELQEPGRRLRSKFASTLEVLYEKGQAIRVQLIDLCEVEGQLLTLPAVMTVSWLVLSDVLRSPELVEAIRSD